MTTGSLIVRVGSEPEHIHQTAGPPRGGPGDPSRRAKWGGTDLGSARTHAVTVDEGCLSRLAAQGGGLCVRRGGQNEIEARGLEKWEVARVVDPAVSAPLKSNPDARAGVAESSLPRAGAKVDAVQLLIR